MDPTANEGVSAFSGLKYFRALMEGSIARSAMLKLFDINIEAVEPGLVVLTAVPTEEHYNPLGFVHGGYAAVLLDTCMAAAIAPALPARWPRRDAARCDPGA
jgi:acyl-coenzyme A thioesterase PaaI-like protein